MSEGKSEEQKKRGRQPGTPKTGGRKRGTPNKDKQAFLDRLNKEFPNYHPVVAMAHIATMKITR